MLVAVHGEPRDERGDAQASSWSAWASWAAASSTSRRTSISSSSIRRTARPTARARCEPRVLRPPGPPRHRALARRHRRRLRVPRRHAAAALRRQRPAGASRIRRSSSIWSRRAARGSATRGSRRAPLTGTRHDELDALVMPFVFRKYLDFDAYEGLRDIHRQIREQGKRQATTRRTSSSGRAASAKSSSSCRRCSWCAAAASRRCAFAARFQRWRPSASVALCLRPKSRRSATRTFSCAMSSTACSIATTSRRRRCPLTPPSAMRSQARWVSRRAAFDERCRAHARRSPRIAKSSAGGSSAIPTVRPTKRASRRGRPRRRCRRSGPATTGHGAATLASGLRRSPGSSSLLSAFARSARYVQLPALSRQRFECAGAAALLGVGAANPGNAAPTPSVFPAPARAARGGQPAQRLSGAPDRAPADAAAARPIDGGVAMGRRLPDAPSDSARRVARCARAARRARLGRVAHRAWAPAGKPPGRRRATDGRAAPFPACADVSPARAGPGRRVDRRAARRSPFGAGRHRPRRDAHRSVGVDGRPRRGAAAIRDHRVRQARRQGTGLRVRSRSRVSVRRPGRRVGAGALCAARAAAEHLAHQHDPGRTALRRRRAAAPGRREGPDVVVARGISPL